MIIKPVKVLYVSLFLILCVLVTTSCQNLRPSQHPLVQRDHVHNFGATRIAFSPSGKLLASGGFQGEIKLWSVPGGKLIKTLKRHLKPIRGLVWVNNKILISAAEDGKLIRWNTHSSRVLYVKQLKSMSSMAWSKKLQQLVTGHKNGQVSLRSVRKFTLIKKLKYNKKILSVSADNQGKYFAVSTSGRDVMLFNTDFQLLKKFRGARKKIYELRFSPDNKTLAGSSWFNILLWNINTGRLVKNKTEHFGAIVSLDFHPDGKRMISIGRHTDATLRLSQVRGGKTIRRLAAHEYCGWNVRFSPSGRYVASSSEDEGIRLYDMASPYKPTFAPVTKPKQ